MSEIRIVVPYNGAKRRVDFPFDVVANQQIEPPASGEARLEYAEVQGGPWYEAGLPDSTELVIAKPTRWDSRDFEFSFVGVTIKRTVWVRVAAHPREGTPIRSESSKIGVLNISQDHI